MRLCYSLFFGVLSLMVYGAKDPIVSFVPVDVKPRSSANQQQPLLKNVKKNQEPVKPQKIKLKCEFINATIPSGFFKICSSKRAPLSMFKTEKGWIIGWDEMNTLDVPNVSELPLGVRGVSKLNDQSLLVTFDSAVHVKLEADDTCWYIMNDVSTNPPEKEPLKSPTGVFEKWSIPLEAPSKFYKTTFDEGEEFYWITSSQAFSKAALTLPEIRFFESAQGLAFTPIQKNIVIDQDEKVLTLTNSFGWNWVDLKGQELILPPTLFTWDPEAIKKKDELKQKLQKDPSEKNSPLRGVLISYYLMLNQTTQAKADLLWLKSQYPSLKNDPKVDFLNLVIQVMEDDPSSQEGDIYTFKELEKFPEARIFLSVLCHQQTKRLKKSPLGEPLSLPAELASHYLKDYSPFMKERLVVPLLEQAVDHHNTPMMEALFADEFTPVTPSFLTYFNYLKAKKLIHEGKINEALALLDVILTQKPTTELYTKVRYEQIKQGLGIGTVKLDDAITDLKMLLMTWQGDDFSYEMSRYLLNLYEKAERMIPYLKLLKNLTELYGVQSEKDGLSALIQKGFLQTFQKHQKNYTPLELISLYEEFKFYTPDAPQDEEIINGAIDAFKKLDLLAQAAALFTKNLESKPLDEEGAKKWLEVAKLHLENDDVKSALATIARLDNTPFSLREKNLLIARCYMHQQAYDKAFDVMSPYKDEEAYKVSLVCLMRQKKWAQTIDIFKQLCPSLTDVQERNKWVIYWLSCLRLAQDDSIIASIKKVYEKDFEKDDQKPLFLLLTDPGFFEQKDFTKTAFKNLIKKLDDYEKVEKQLK